MPTTSAAARPFMARTLNAPETQQNARSRAARMATPGYWDGDRAGLRATDRRLSPRSVTSCRRAVIAAKRVRDPPAPRGDVLGSMSSCSSHLRGWLVDHGLTDGAVDGQTEDVVAAVVAGDVEGTVRRRDARRFDLGEQQPVLFMERAGNDLAARCHDDGIAGVQPLVRVRKQLLAAGEPGGHIAGPERAARADHPAAALRRDVPHRRDPGVAFVPGGRHIRLESRR